LLARQATGARVAGATFDAAGFRPSGQGTRTPPGEALAAIVADRDARFPALKLFAVETLGQLRGPEVIAALIRTLRDEASPGEVRDRAAEVLIKRKDETGLPAIIDALAVHTDAVAGAYPRGVEVLARAAAAIGSPEAGPALIAHLNDPATSVPALSEVIPALVTIQARDAFVELRSYLLMYRCDPRYEADPQILGEVIDAVLAVGGGAGREAISWVADEPRTIRGVAAYARKALGQ